MDPGQAHATIVLTTAVARISLPEAAQITVTPWCGSFRYVRLATATRCKDPGIIGIVGAQLKAVGLGNRQGYFQGIEINQGLRQIEERQDQYPPEPRPPTPAPGQSTSQLPIQTALDLTFVFLYGRLATVPFLLWQKQQRTPRRRSRDAVARSPHMTGSPVRISGGL